MQKTQTFSFSHSVNVIARCGMRFREDRLREEGLGGAQCHYLISICRTPGISQDALCKQLFVNKSSVARQLCTLEQNGYVTRTADEKDRRALNVFPTDKALRVLPKVRSVLRAWNALVLEGFTEDEIETLTALVERVRVRASATAERIQEGR